ncbi:4-hydroxyphenylpyruvate dioxygenase [Plantactinospora soyae]|uniref:4-hydroxymandelate synthase n=1 Tax=Plantactinospora soyae TaxID=1544732 RepID=A0A927M6R1_9ACTN|nr:4-hydroxyphenylpyruvate dioxygenase [Plantactinospora soyae]MBE1489198.1 4-hydroxymandelate synthase [Plantactinospora soyae]
MTAQQIAFVELYASEQKAAVDYLASALGFTEVAESEDEASQSVLLRQGRVQLVVTTGPCTERFIEAHGDGVADLALGCDDVAASHATAIAAGATDLGTSRGNPIVSGFGSVRHTLVPASADVSPPAGHAWRPVSADLAPAPRIRLLDHVAICVEHGSLDQYADFYAAGFGLGRYSSEFVDVGGSSMDSVVVRGGSDDVTFTFVAPGSATGTGQLNAFLDRNGGPGVQHLALLVDDIVSAVSEAGQRGVDFLRTPASYYDLLAERFPDMPERIAGLRTTNVLADRDEWGYLLQLFTRSPYPRNTLFYELIQRRGARGFGSANIRALYEAVERDRLTAR